MYNACYLVLAQTHQIIVKLAYSIVFQFGDEK